MASFCDILYVLAGGVCPLEIEAPRARKCTCAPLKKQVVVVEISIMAGGIFVVLRLQRGIVLLAVLRCPLGLVGCRLLHIAAQQQSVV